MTRTQTKPNGPFAPKRNTAERRTAAVDLDRVSAGSTFLEQLDL
ncbi:hypothetical protein ACFOGJ_28835 [Marinibaculum pumilum]|uniref:Uncharacterized protein n=1 Tax=Marinibaculum pumilum TaxID=1766165 RepID=A0ABV7L9T6_9PROT